MIKFRVNGKGHSFDGDMDMPLLWYLREDADMKGTKFGCGIGECGACTVHMGDVAVRSCSVPMSALDGGEITTIEGLAQKSRLHAVQQAWIDEDVAQCGYCQAGQVMATAAFLKEYPTPTDADIDENLSNLCRCGTYYRMRKAIHRAARTLRGEA
ncbi:(2Fe-2S)-binding protein [Paremcibacter congregatus]|uniref:(2Fe-2S)-binding protein n=1 Tax=Paremcibacter congregatus TaxID=2043170 RepID=A0A2G4YMA4_9PROT|nr:(2Fe-2S)-binding protein [Paremcibacter congregatus]PHZ83427.1 (2Fe-2S)-binding protein [Paremcibacter congregatus]QDE28105.1 (2Fe-2S)-binding protein [Paremcibacter congregatus]|tara:strand:- start:4894 stop:5358 length:465 start_codon:yes stop_codon:yes gene_type:complete